MKGSNLVRVAVATLLAAVLVVPGANGPSPAHAQPSGPIRVDLVPDPGTEFTFGGRTYAGVLSVTWHRDGLAVVEDVPLDTYLAGIREVPLSWPEATLEAQAVAARTYLAWTLDRGRSSDGNRYDFDICATTQCQVYAGTGVVEAADGDRWLAAIEATRNQILVYDGAPAQTLYSSSAGSRTRAVEDVWGGTAKPYLSAVDSPEAGVTPYEQWVVTVDVEAMRRVLAAAGVSIGSQVRSVAVDRPAEGGGPATLVIESEMGRTAIPATTVRTRFNQYAPVLYPGVFPAARPDGRRWPQAIMSYTFDVQFAPGAPLQPAGPLPVDDLPSQGVVSFVGEGWGHGVGMSQWGAKAMGDRGSSHEAILGHYYGGLEPVDGGAAIPATVRVGLAWGMGYAPITASGPFELRINGVPAGVYGPGEWGFRATAGGVGVLPPSLQQALASLLAHRSWPR